MVHPNLYNDNIVTQKHTKDGTFIHTSHPQFGHAIIQTHDADGELLAGEEDKINPRRTVVATGQQKHIDKKFKELGPAVQMPTKNEEVEFVPLEEMETQIDEGIHSVKSMVEGILAGHLVESTETFSSILADKISEKLAEAKIEVAQGIFAESSDDEDDEKSAETSDEDFSKHPLNQLQKIADYKPNTDKEDLEYTASGDVDKRSLRALEDRKKNKGSTSACPTFKHSNGEETNLEPEHAQHMVNVLKSSSIKPETKKSVFDAMHGSKAGFSKIQGALGTGVVKNKSIYGDDSRA